VSDYLDEISAFVSRCQFDDLSPIILQRAKEVMADGLAVIATGTQEKEVKALTQHLLVPCGKQVATLLGQGIRTESLKAALINGTAGTFLELDEGNRFAGGHPATHVIPATLAVAEERNLSGSEVLNALVLGYEIGARIAIASKLRRSMHPHGTWGTVGAAVAVGKLMNYGEHMMKEMVNLSSSLTLATSRRTILEGATVRNVYAGISGYMGILAHHLIESGFTGEANGLGSVFGSVVSETFSPEEMTKDLGKRFEIARNYFKQHACCRHIHSSLDAMAIIAAKMPRGRIEPEKIAKVKVRTYSLAAQLSDQQPKNILASKFSIPFAVGTFILNGNAGVHCFTQENLENPVIKALARKVTVVEDTSLTAMMPERRPASIQVVLNDGTVLEAETFIAKGDVEVPYSSEEKRRKFYELVGPIWGHKLAESIYSDFMELEKLGNINQLTDRINQRA